jgi:hypothetical protein
MKGEFPFAQILFHLMILIMVHGHGSRRGTKVCDRKKFRRFI